MKLFQTGKDGGRYSTVDGFWLIEIKWLFSIVLLRFNPGSREAYHSHAFNAWSWFLWGDVDEHHLGGKVLNHTSGKLKRTPRNTFHKVWANRTTWCLTFRGPWAKTWKEYIPETNEIVTLANGRVELDRKKVVVFKRFSGSMEVGGAL